MLSVVDTNWHNFMSDDGGTETCLTCGGMWEFTDKITDPEFPDSIERTYHALNGDAPSRCNGDSYIHGEAPCEHNNGRPCDEADSSDDGSCAHRDKDCNCVFCA